MKNKVFLILFICSAASLATAQQKQLNYVIKGLVNSQGLKDSVRHMRLTYYTDGDNVTDSVPVRNGRFTFRGTVPVPTQAQLTAIYSQLNGREKFMHNQQNSRALYLGEGELKVLVSSNLKAAVITGSQRTADMDVFDGYMTKYLENNEAVYQQTRNDPADEVRRAKRSAALKAVEDARKRFIMAYPDNVFALQAMKDAIQVYQNKNLFKPGSDSLYKELVLLHSQLTATLKDSPEGHEVAARLTELSTRKLPQFSGPSLAGGTLDINTYKGRVFLIDFWGSWCVWCRKGHPHLKEIYAKYQSKGFEIIGVGVEFDKDRGVAERKLREAIAKDGITWPQIFNINNGDNDLRKIFSIYAYPTKILVDQSGNIILRVTDDEERKLDAKLAELFNPKN